MNHLKIIFLSSILILTNSFLKSQNQEFINLDTLTIDSIVVTDFHTERNFFDSPNAITLITDPLNKSISGISGLLSGVPGVFIDGSLGEVYTRIYTRGISESAEDDIGWYYQSLQEDGLPVSAIQYNYFTPDLFQRTDLMTQKVEIIRGGKSGILVQNAPGGAINFISSNPSSVSNKIKTTFGLLGQSNPYYRLDGVYSFPTQGKNWSILLAGFYRHDEGHRNTDYPWNRGGQLRSKFQKVFKNGVFNLTAKYLNDHVNRYTGMSAMNWNKPVASFDQNFNYTALMLPELKTNVPGPEAYSFNSANGIHVKESAVQANMSLDLNVFRLDISGKVSSKSTDWSSSFANQPLGLESFLPYFLSGAQFPFGTIKFTDVETQETLAVVNNFGALNAFQGEIPSFEYLEGSLPNDALMGIAPWKKKDFLDEQILQLGLSREFNAHNFYLGSFYGHSELKYFTSASFAFATFEAQSRLLKTTLINSDGSELLLSDGQGMTNYGGLFHEKGEMDINQLAFFFNDNIDLTEKINIDLGLRYEKINHDGYLNIASPIDLSGGLDGNMNTDYDNGTIVSTGESQEIDFVYDYLSYSVAFSYTSVKGHKILSRYSRTKKAPELNIYIQNFSGLPINDPGEVQTISQLEITYRVHSQNANVSLTAFRSQLENIALSDFLFDQQSGEIFYTPIQLNNTVTVGLEMEWKINLSDKISMQGSQTWQDSEAKKYSIYDSAGSADISDDMTLDYSGNDLPHIPILMSKIGLEVDLDKFIASMNWQYMGARYGNIENAFRLNQYSTFGLAGNYKISESIELGLQITNMFNSSGLLNFFGPNEFGSSANQATESYIVNNPNASFVVFPILPRAVYLSASFDF